MADKITRDTGMMQRTATRYSMNDPSDADHLSRALRALSASLPVRVAGDWTGDALRRSNAERCRAILATVELSTDGMCDLDTELLREKGLAENSAQWIAAQWLAEHSALMRARERFGNGDATPGNLGRMLVATEEMGRLQERLWWRAGIDPLVKKTREALAVGKREQERAIGKATEARSVQAIDARPDWHDLAIIEAREIRQKHPTYSRWRIAGELYKNHEVSRDRMNKVLKENGLD